MMENSKNASVPTESSRQVRGAGKSIPNTFRSFAPKESCLEGSE